VRDIETIDSELRLMAALRRAAGERSGPLPSIDMADTLLDERSRLGEGSILTPPHWRELAANALAAADQLDAV
jgi:hypothetical protein